MFELHCTIRNAPPQLKRICEEMGIPIIEISLLDKNNQEIELQQMTSLKTQNISNEWKKLKHITAICNAQIVRTKVETTPYNKYPALYYECHFHAPYNMPFPRSLRKDRKCDDIGYTLRAKTLEEFNKIYQENNIHLFVKKIEKCVIDTNINLDGDWI